MTKKLHRNAMPVRKIPGPWNLHVTKGTTYSVTN